MTLSQRTCSSRTGADGPQAEERAMAADAHHIARVPCDEFLFLVFLAEALKKTRSVRLWKKGPVKFSNICFYSNSLKFSPTMFYFYLATISGLSLPTMLAPPPPPPPPRDPSVGGKRRREDLPTPPSQPQQ
jgi:hypothetical protein